MHQLFIAGAPAMWLLATHYSLMPDCRLDSSFCIEEDIFFGGAIDFIFQGQDQDTGTEHESRHEVVAHVEAARFSLDPGHHVRSEHAAQVAAGVDKGDGAGSGRAGKEGRRDGPPYAHGSMDADSRQADEEQGDAHVMSERRQTKADSTDGEGAEDMPYFIACNRSRMADDKLDDEGCHHRNSDSSADERGGPAGEVLEDRRHPEVEAPETDDPEEVDEAEFQDFRIGKGLEDRVFLDALHLGLFFLVHSGQVFFFSIRQPAGLVGTVFNGKEEIEGKAEGRDGFQNEQFLLAQKAEEGVFQEDAGDRSSDDGREEQRCQHERRSPGPFGCREPAGEQQGVDDRIEAGFGGP